MASGASVSGKIRRPRVASDTIARPGPTILLDRVPDHRITLVTAPAGFGKSWLVSNWVDQRPDLHQSWVTIDTYDRDPIRLWRHIIESVGSSGSSKAAELLAAGQSGISLVVDSMAADLAQRTKPTIIVLDNVQHLDGDESCRSIDQFLAELPNTTHVILVGRHDPGLRLARWRLSGDLLEIRTADLRCTLPEAEVLVTEVLGLSLAPEIVAGLHTKTMGWIAAIRLAAVATSQSSDMRRSADQVPGITSLDWTHDVLGRYLVEEVLDHLEESDRQFLLDTSILRDLTAPLCDTVSERTDSHARLEQLARSSIFTTRLGDSADCYRYHDLFRETLTGVLRLMAPDRELELHRRAAMWLHDHGDPVAAIEHALGAGAPDLAGQWLVEASREMLLAGQHATMRTLFGRVDKATDRLPPIVLAAWCYPITFGDVPGAVIDDVIMRTLDSVEAMVKANDVQQLDEWARFQDLVRGSPSQFSVRAAGMLAHRHGDTDTAFRLVEELAGPSDGGRVEAVAGEMLIYLGRYAEGSDLLSRFNEFSFTLQNPVIDYKAVALGLQAWAAIGEGRLRLAEILAARGGEIMQSHGFGHLPQAAVTKVPLAWVAYERGQLDVALGLVTPVVDLLGRFGEVPAYVYAHTLLARINHSRGDHDAALASLDRARLLPSGLVVVGHFADHIAFEQSRLALLNSDLAAAEIALGDWRQRCERGATTMAEHLLLARFLVAAGDDPLPMLDTQPEMVDITSVHGIENHKLRALTALRDGDDAVALYELTEAMKSRRTPATVRRSWTMPRSSVRCSTTLPSAAVTG